MAAARQLSSSELLLAMDGRASTHPPLQGVKSRVLKPKRTLPPLAPSRRAPTTPHQVLVKDEDATALATARSARLSDNLGFSFDDTLLLLRRSDVSYPETTLPVWPYDKPLPLPDARQGPGLVDAHHYRYPYRTSSLSSPSSADPPFITYENMPYAHYEHVDGDKCLVTVRSELPITPLPPRFLQHRCFAVLPHDAQTLAPPICMVMRTAPCDGEDDGEAHEFPIPLHEIVRDTSPWPLPTVTQITDLVTRIVAEMDWLSPSLYFIPTLTSIYIANPSALGSGVPLKLRLCPFSLGMRHELPEAVPRHLIMRRATAMLLFQLSLWVTDTHRLDCHHLVADAIVAAPGLIAAYHEIARACDFDFRARLAFNDAGQIVGMEDGVARTSNDVVPLPPQVASYAAALQRLLDRLGADDASLAPPNARILPAMTVHRLPDLNHDESMQRLSPTIDTFNRVRSRSPREYDLEHVPGLLQAVSCVHARTMNTVAVDALYTLLCKHMSRRVIEARNGTRDLLINSCVARIAAFVPSLLTAMQDPTSVSKSMHWARRMYAVFIVLDEVERSGRYSLLRTAQQAIFAAGINKHLTGHSRNPDSKFALGLLVPIVCVAVMSSHHFPALRVRLIFDKNVRKMAKMLKDAEARPDMSRYGFPPIDANTLIGMMMVMSNCGSWCKPDGEGDATLARILDEVPDHVLLVRLLPCIDASTCDATVAWLVRRLERAVDTLVSEIERATVKDVGPLRAALDCALDWCVALAWNAPAQVTNASYHSLYTSYFMAIALRCPNRLVLEANVNFAYHLCHQSHLAGVAAEENGVPPLAVANVCAATHAPPSARYVDASQMAGMDWHDSDSEDGVDHVGEREARTHPSGHAALTATDTRGGSVAKPLSRALFTPPRTPPASRCDDACRSPNDHYHPPDAIHNLANAAAASFDLNNPLEFALVPNMHKEALNPIDIVNYHACHLDSLASRLYVPMCAHNEAPEGDSDCYFTLPPPNDDGHQFVQYHTPPQVAPPPALPINAAVPPIVPMQCRESCVRSLQVSEIAALYPLEDPSVASRRFVPVTLAASNLPLCAVKERVVGTTGMMEVKLVDSGETNDLIVGITWSLAEEGAAHASPPLFTRKPLERVVPGLTPTSVGLSTAGVLYYVDASGSCVASYYTAPFCTGSKVSVGVAYDRVYFIVDGIFYPPVPGLTIPKSSRVHGLVRFGCAGLKITMRHMSAVWNQNRNGDGSLIHAQTNPVAHSLYLAELRPTVCPHYHAHMREPGTRPQLASLRSRLASVRPLLGERAVRKVELVALAGEACPAGCCRAPQVVRDEVAAVSSSCSAAASTQCPGHQ